MPPLRTASAGSSRTWKAPSAGSNRPRAGTPGALRLQKLTRMCITSPAFPRATRPRSPRTPHHLHRGQQVLAFLVAVEAELVSPVAADPGRLLRPLRQAAGEPLFRAAVDRYVHLAEGRVTGVPANGRR